MLLGGKRPGRAPETSCIPPLPGESILVVGVNRVLARSLVTVHQNRGSTLWGLLVVLLVAVVMVVVTFPCLGIYANIIVLLSSLTPPDDDDDDADENEDEADDNDDDNGDDHDDDEEEDYYDDVDDKDDIDKTENDNVTMMMVMMMTIMMTIIIITIINIIINSKYFVAAPFPVERQPLLKTISQLSTTVYLGVPGVCASALCRHAKMLDVGRGRSWARAAAVLMQPSTDKHLKPGCGVNRTATAHFGVCIVFVEMRVCFGVFGVRSH